MTFEKQLTYDQMVVCYLDILGFKQMVGQKEKLFKLVETIQNVNTASETEIYRKHLVIEKLQVSDGILFWSKINSFKELVIFLTKIGFAISALSILKIPLRGAISYGDHFFQDGILISPAFIEAYEHEQSVAIFPRVIATKSFMTKSYELAEKTEDPKKAKRNISLLLRRDFDGFRFVNYLGYFGVSLNVNEEKTEISFSQGARSEVAFSQHMEMIEEGILSEITSIRSKYIWLGRYHNDFLRFDTQFQFKNKYLINETKLEHV